VRARSGSGEARLMPVKDLLRLSSEERQMLSPPVRRPIARKVEPGGHTLAVKPRSNTGKDCLRLSLHVCPLLATRFESDKVDIYLTQVAATCSMSGYGGISAEPEGVRRPVRD
jgi:hypothetical protein